jgi:Fic/DOC family
MAARRTTINTTSSKAKTSVAKPSASRAKTTTRAATSSKPKRAAASVSDNTHAGRSGAARSASAAGAATGKGAGTAKGSARPTKKATKPAKPVKSSAKEVVARSTKKAAPPSKVPAAKVAPKPSAAAVQREKLRLAKEREKAQLLARKEKERLAKEREKAQLLARKEKEQLAKERDKVRLLAQKEKERLTKELEKARQQADREKERLSKEREKLRLAQEAEKERARLEVEAEKERVRLAREAEKERLRKDKEAEKDRIERAKLAERDRLIREKEAEKERQRLEREAEKERVIREKEAEKDRIVREKEAEKERLRLEREVEKERLRAEREAEKERLRAEREAEKERLRAEREAEKERLRKEKDEAQEAYRKAKEAEQTRLRTEREAARKALEGRISKQTARIRGAARVATSSRVYSPSSIPDQSGTRVGGRSVNKFANLRTLPPPPDSVQREVLQDPALLAPPPPPELKPETLEERYALIQERLGQAEVEFRREYEANFLMSWIYHDSALEGVVYTYEELKIGVNPDITVIPDSSIQSVCEGIRRHKNAIQLVQELGEKKRQPVTLDMLKRIYLTLHPEEGDLKTVKYRRDIPQHRLYFHEYAAPDKIAPKIRNVFDWLNGPEPRKLKTPLKVAGRVHYDLLRIFPFEKDSGKVTRLFMNLLLLRLEHPPAIIHLTERQRYYEALKGSPNTLNEMLFEAVDNALMSVEKILEERDTRHRAIV